MKYQPTILSQLLNVLPRDQFQQIVTKYHGDFKTHKLDCWSQFVSLFYAQLRQRDSLRDVETGLETQFEKLYHLGLKPVKRSTLADANAKRDYRIYEEVFQVLLSKCRQFGTKTFKFESPLLVLDASVITLCHTLFPWAKYQSKKGGLKLHLYYDHDNDLPEFISLTEGKDSDRAVGRTFPVKPDSIAVFDRGYTDYAWFYALHQRDITFVTRVSKAFTFTPTGQQPNPSENPDIIADQRVRIPAAHSHQKRRYPETVRLVSYYDSETQRHLQFLTNNFSWTPETIALIYKKRWGIELFFKWIKQNLKIKTFLGTSKNAVFTQIWIAMCVYLVLWFLKHQAKYSASMLRLSRVLNEAAFERTHLINILRIKSWKNTELSSSSQLTLGFT